MLLPDQLRDRRHRSVNVLKVTTSIGHQYVLRNNKLASTITNFNDILPIVENFLIDSYSFDVPFDITLKSAVVDGVKRKFTFNNLYHFKQWVRAIQDNNEAPGSVELDNFYNANDQNNNVFAQLFNVADSIQIVQGGCGKVSKKRSIKGLFFKFNLNYPKSKDNNCGIECLKMCKGMNESFYLLPHKVIRDSINVKGKIKLTIDHLKQIYEIYQEEGHILAFINRDFDGLYNKKYNYIFYTKTNHYCHVETMMSRDFRSKDERTLRGTLAFDFETRNLDKYDTVKSSGAKSRHMCDTIVKFVFRRYKSDKLEKMGFISNSKKTAARQFLDWLHEEHRNGKYFTCLAHNGANFDFYLLVKEFTENEVTHSTLSLRGTSIIHMQFCKHVFKDPCCFMPASLDYLCKSFKIDDENKKLKKFEIPISRCSTEMTTLSNTEMCFYKPHLNFEEFLQLQHTEKTYWNLYEKYCENDCTALYEIWTKFRKAYEKIVYELGDNSDTLLKQGYTLNSGNTIGSLSKRLLVGLTKKSVAKKQYEKFFKEDKVLTIKDDSNLRERFPKYSFVSKFKRGGISHCHQNGRHDHQIASVDINSQYPASLVMMKIPCGESMWVTRYRPIWFGYYHLKNIVFDLKPGTFLPICPIPKKNKSLDWAVQEQCDGKLVIDEAYVDSFMIEYLFENYNLESFDVVNGLVSTKFVYGRELFGKYVSVLYKSKADQDLLKDSKSPLYNPALRSCIKLFLNAVTGKLVESTEKYFTIEYVLQNNLDTNINNIRGVSYTKVRNKWKPNLWVGCGVMVYSYSKRLLFEYIRHIPADIIHVETDGIYFNAKDYPRFYNAINNYEQPIHLKDGVYPVAFGNKLGNIKLEHISEGCKIYEKVDDKDLDLLIERKQKQNGPWRPAYFNGKKNYFFHCSIEKHNIEKLKGFPSATINESGEKVKIINMQLYSDVFNGKSVTKEYASIRKVLHGETRLISFRQSRTVHPNKKRKIWI